MTATKNSNADIIDDYFIALLLLLMLIFVRLHSADRIKHDHQNRNTTSFSAANDLLNLPKRQAQPMSQGSQDSHHDFRHKH